MRVTVARIGRPHGIRGQVTVEVRTDDPDTRFAAGSVLLTDPPEVGPLTVTSTARSGRILLLSFAGIDTRDDAERLRNTLLQVDVDALPPADDPDEYYDHQLLGLTAHHVDGTTLGTITDILHAPAAPVLEVTGATGATLVPFVAAIVPEVDLDAGTLTIDPPSGMFDGDGP